MEPKGLFEMKFSAVKRGPSTFVVGTTVYHPGDIVKLPYPYSRRPEFELVEPLPEVKAPEPSQEESVYVPGEIIHIPSEIMEHSSDVRWTSSDENPIEMMRVKELRIFIESEGGKWTWSMRKPELRELALKLSEKT